MLARQLLCARSTLHTCSNHINYANAAKLSLLLNCAGGAERWRRITSAAFPPRQTRQFFTRQTCVSSLMLMEMTLNVFTRTGASVQRRARAFYDGALSNETRQASGANVLFTGDACMPLCVRLTDHECVPLSRCCRPVDNSGTGRTFGDAERGAQEASGLPGQRTGRDI